MKRPRDIKLGEGVRFRAGKGYYLISPSADGKAFYITVQQASIFIEPYSNSLVFVDCRRYPKTKLHRRVGGRADG